MSLSATITASNPSVSFPDGNIIIQVESTSFRLYRGLLAARSTFFNDLFSLPPPEQGNEVGNDGCPVVTLYDDESDAKAFFRAIVDCGSFDPPPSTQIINFTDLAGILRLATKYDVPFLRRRAIRHVEWYLPRDLTTFQHHVGLYLDYMGGTLDTGGSTSQNFEGFMSATPTFLRLAIELDVTWLIPHLMFFTVLSGLFSHHNTPHSDLTLSQPHSTPESWLSSDSIRQFDEPTRRRLYEGWVLLDALIPRYLDQLFSRLTRSSAMDAPPEFPLGVMLEAEECADRDSCKEFWGAKLGDLFASPPDHPGQRWKKIRAALDEKSHLWNMKLPPTVKPGQAPNATPAESSFYCEPCKKDIDLSLHNLSRIIWIGLPLIFETPGWPELQMIRGAALNTEPEDSNNDDDDSTDDLYSDESPTLPVNSNDDDDGSSSSTESDEDTVQGIVSLVDWMS
ncbi:hypothetical protein BDN72DRAFT_800209 [Pluteus cervinus]|uniref:Uncharacterized protein n=1 Tax=Pluteus cervinus TaxID=181527 RepID=A0ACD3ALR7_9AGAR|nr:hypothetical protein BDN72DRAFT_800209 [Pluteus cervinus]